MRLMLPVDKDLQKRDVTHDASKNVVEIMGNATSEYPQRVKLFNFLSLIFMLFQFRNILKGGDNIGLRMARVHRAEQPAQVSGLATGNGGVGAFEGHRLTCQGLFQGFLHPRGALPGSIKTKELFSA